MAHKINDMINKAENRQLVNCHNKCKYWKFGHLQVACVLSSVFAVKTGEPCYEYEEGKDGAK